MSFLINSYRYVIAQESFDSYSYTNDNATSSYTSVFSTRDAIGIRVNTGGALVGVAPTAVTWKIYKQQDPTGGNIECRIYTSVPETGRGTLQETSSTVPSIESLSDGEIFTYTFSGNYSLQADDIICLFNTDTSGSSGSNYISYYYNSSSADSDNFTVCEYGGLAWEYPADYSTYLQVVY